MEKYEVKRSTIDSYIDSVLNGNDGNCYTLELVEESGKIYIGEFTDSRSYYDGTLTIANIQCRSKDTEEEIERLSGIDDKVHEITEKLEEEDEEYDEDKIREKVKKELRDDISTVKKDILEDMHNDTEEYLEKYCGVVIVED